MRIFNVYDERRPAIAARRSACIVKIARQREQLAAEIERMRVPFRAFDIALGVGIGLREHAAAVSVVAVPLLLFAGRRLARGAGVAVRLTRKATRWWTVWKLGSSLFSGWRRNPAAGRR